MSENYDQHLTPVAVARRAGGPDCPRCVALEGEVRRLRETVERLSDDSLMVLEAEVSSSRALLAELAAAARARDAGAVDPACVPEALQRHYLAVLTRAEAEAGGAG